MVPGAVLAGLWLTRHVRLVPAVLAEVAIVAGLMVLAAVWLADLRRLALLVEEEPALAARLWPLRGLGRDMRRRLAERDLEGAQARAASNAEHAIIELMPDPVLMLSADRAVLSSNRAAREVLGGDIPAVLRHPTLRGAIDRVQSPTARAGERVQSAELLIPVPVARDLQATVINLGDSGAGMRTAVVLADRTRARAVERMRADFVANASHELRTPLASLIGFIDTLRGPAVDDIPAQQRFLNIMAEQAARMNRLIDDLLSLSRIELTEHVAPSERVDLAELTERALQAFEPRRVAQGCLVAAEIAPGLPAVMADADQLEQVLQNLLDNALKYGRAGSTIHVRLHATAGGGTWPIRPGIVLSVRDEGLGIPREHLPRLTERFYRVDRGRSRAAGGTGLGLAIVKHIVTRHRGQLVVESTEGVGSCFSVWLPRALVPVVE